MLFNVAGLTVEVIDTVNVGCCYVLYYVCAAYSFEGGRGRFPPRPYVEKTLVSKCVCCITLCMYMRKAYKKNSKVVIYTLRLRNIVRFSRTSRLSTFLYMYFCSILPSSTICNSLSSSIVCRILPCSTVCRILSSRTVYKQLDRLSY